MFYSRFIQDRGRKANGMALEMMKCMDAVYRIRLVGEWKGDEAGKAVDLLCYW